MQPDGSSRVFLQTTVPIDAQPAIVGNQMRIDLGDARIVGTNRYPLYTQFFNTPVTRVAVRREKKRTILELTLRLPVQPRLSTEQAPSGYHFLYIDFPIGDYLPKAATATRAAPPPPTRVEGTALEPAAPTHLETSAGNQAQGSGRASGAINTSMDRELPPGMAKPKAKATTKTSTSGSLKIGK
jgi:hypothetical protein